MLSSPNQKIHFVGVGGSGMSGIAEILSNLGFAVSGSDTKEGHYTARLQDIGISVAFEHNALNVHGKDLLVISSAIQFTNPEIQEANKLNIPILHRIDMLVELMRQKENIIVAGTHGKTTTTSILSHVLHSLQLDPTAVIGGKVQNFNSNAKIGKGKYFIAEADESDGSFLKLTPNIAVVTNVDKDHLEYYGNLNGVIHAFEKFVKRVPKTGTVCLCIDDEHTRKLESHITANILTYGLTEGADITAKNIVTNGFKTEFSPVIFQKEYKPVTLRLPGKYNICNALASFAVAYALQINPDQVGESLSSFSGTLHRYTLLAEIKNHLIIDDYAHNPKKIETVLTGTKESFPNKKIVVVFEPHKYSRLKELKHEFAKCFYYADHLIITPIYSAGEDPIDGVSPTALAQSILKENPTALESQIKTSENFDEAVEYCVQYLKTNPINKDGVIFLVLGAGNISYAGHILKERLQCET